MKIPLKDIAVVKRQRKQIDPKELQALANSILARGRLIHPINVRPTRPDDKYETGPSEGQAVREPWMLLTGGRRYAAHVMIDWPEIEAQNFDDLDQIEQQVVELEENIIRADITWQEEIDAKARINELRKLKNPEHTDADTAEELGEHKSNLSKDLKLHKMMQEDPSLKDAPTKKAAIRKAAFKTEINARVAAIKQTDVGTLREKLVTQDMRDYARAQATHSVDLVFCDFPFGINYDKHYRGAENNSMMQGKYEDSPETLMDLLTDVVPHIVRMVKPSGWIACMMGWTNYSFLAHLFRDCCRIHFDYRMYEDGVTGSIPKDFCRVAGTHDKCEFAEPESIPWMWYRPNSRQPSLWPELHANNQYELICVVNGGKAKLVRPNVGNVLAIDAVYSERIHEMQRPHELCKEIISRFTVTGEKVVDLCFGSGSSLAAAADLARDFAGCDINPDNLGPALMLVSQFYKGKYVLASIKSPEQIRAQHATDLAEIEARASALAEPALTEEEEASIQ